MRIFTIIAALSLILISPAQAQYLGNLSSNRYLPPAPPQLPGTFTNQFGTSSNSPQLYNNQGQYRGNLNANKFDPNSVANPFGRYGSQFSPDGINNPFGAGSPYRADSPNNPFGNGLRVYRPQ